MEACRTPLVVLGRQASPARYCAPAALGVSRPARAARAWTTVVTRAPQLGGVLRPPNWSSSPRGWRASTGRALNRDSVPVGASVLAGRRCKPR
jgi:hypothetical protein